MRAREMSSSVRLEALAFIAPDLWPPNINLQYKIWRPTQKCMQRTSLHNASDLKQRASLTRGRISQKNIDEAVNQRRTQLSMYAKAKETIPNNLLN